MINDRIKHAHPFGVPNARIEMRCENWAVIQFQNIGPTCFRIIRDHHIHTRHAKPNGLGGHDADFLQAVIQHIRRDFELCAMTQVFMVR